MKRSCPDCALELESKVVQGVHLDTCRKCAGIFFDDGEIATVKRQSPIALSELDSLIEPEEAGDAFRHEKVRLCPACSTTMTAYRYMYSSPVVLDACENCGGIWVENGELRMMAEYARGPQGTDTNEAVVAQMKAITEASIHRAKIAERSMRLMSKRLYTRWQ
jgi:Zn-finger nucleic acid-binding protein